MSKSIKVKINNPKQTMNRIIDDRGSPWAKKDTKKHYTGRNLKYTYPGASSHWEEVAERKHKSKVAQEITDYIKKR